MVKTDLTTFVYAGNRRLLDFTVEDEDAGDGSALPITGLTVRFSMARIANGVPVVDSPVVDLSTAGAQVTITDGPNGVVRVELLATDTEDLAPGGVATTYYFELEIVDSNPYSTVVATGEIEVRPNVVNS